MKPRRTEEEDVVVGPEGHEDTRRLVDNGHLDVGEPASFPKRDLAVAHLAEAGSREAVLVAEPGNTRALRKEADTS